MLSILHEEQLNWHLQYPSIGLSQRILSTASTYQNEPAEFAVPKSVAQRLAIVDYRNKTYFRIKRCFENWSLQC
jgi:hypothetical protein